jgi:3-hydroxyacyl-CoA dehydrogenase/enoyl-CoA hydratase/3-hydroxybutyryl-CoA epimerase
MNAMPSLTQFRIEPHDSGLVHLVFDAPERSMNVFSNAAIEDLGHFAEWLHQSDARGVVVRSGKPSGFCAGADLTELGVAYEMIVEAPPADRFDLAFAHFFRLSHAIRRLETAGKPVAAAIAGVALGGGCELALGCHHRVVTRTPRAFLGLPESGVGLLPGAGGTQRMPRLIGLDLGLEVLLQGRNLQGEEALAAGLVHQLVDEGEEVAAAEAWLLSDAAHATQPWDGDDYRPARPTEIAAALERERDRELARMLGHEPAPLAILDCVEFGLIQPLDGAIRAEMSVFAQLIQRREPRNMIRAMFLGKQAYDKARRNGGPDTAVTSAAQRVAAILEDALNRWPELARAGFGNGRAPHPPQERVGSRYWFESSPPLLAAVGSLGAEACAATEGLNSAQQLELDHLLTIQRTVPAYLGGAQGLAEFAPAPDRAPSRVTA